MYFLRRFAFISLFLVFSTSILPGCATNQAVSLQKINSPTVKENKTERWTNQMLQTAMASKVDPHADYVIGPEDLLEIEVFQAEELKRTVRVSSQGFIGMPLAGQIKAKGLTPVQLEEEISRRLDNFLHNPLISIYIKEYKAQKIAVVGAVNLPQVYSATGQRYLLDMLSMAGGIKDEAGAICYILRSINADSSVSAKTETIVIDLDELLEKGNIALNIPVFNGDVINVPKGGMVFIDGAVKKPGAFQLKSGKTTLMQAIAMSEGLKYESDKSNIMVYRDSGTGERGVITADYEAINEGIQDDVLIKDNDIIIVPKSNIKNFLGGFLDAFKGLFHFGKAL